MGGVQRGKQEYEKDWCCLGAFLAADKHRKGDVMPEHLGGLWCLLHFAALGYFLSVSLPLEQWLPSILCRPPGVHSRSFRK